MKFLSAAVFLVLTVCYIRAEELSRENALAVAMTCMEEEGATEEDLEAFKDRQPPVSQEGKCMRSCILHKFGIMNDDGELVKDRAIEVARVIIHEEDKKDLAETLVEACEAIEFDADHCEAAAQYITCMKENAEANGIGLDVE